MKKIDESGINIFGMPYLYGIYIDKVEPFEIDNSAFYNYEAIGYSNPYFVFNGNNYDSSSISDYLNNLYKNNI